MSQTEIQKTEKEIYELTLKLEKLRNANPAVEVKNYTFKTLEGDVNLLELFGDREKLFVIHNMGQGCRYCTLWADGLNAFVPHLESKFAVVLASKDTPEIQRRFSNARGWRFRMVSHNGGEYIKENDVSGGANSPGIVVYERKGNKVYKKNASPFGPGDLFCSIWHVLSLAGLGEGGWQPQYNYWEKPGYSDDGGY
jgi:predicted dithiol-disulfide oxidoreductase (DUF899 family)